MIEPAAEVGMGRPSCSPPGTVGVEWGITLPPQLPLYLRGPCRPASGRTQPHHCSSEGEAPGRPDLDPCQWDREKELNPSLPSLVKATAQADHAPTARAASM